MVSRSFQQSQEVNKVGMRNRIINGTMEIDQRNIGSVYSAPTNNTYALDRWKTYTNGGGVYSVQQSTTVPSGFKNSMVCTVTTADASIAAGDYYFFGQMIEGLNCSDLDYGVSTAKTCTLSFWVRSSIIGTYCVSLRNDADNRSYVDTYTIIAANTWEQKTITFPGDTTGTWVTTNAVGLGIRFDLGSGTTYQGALRTWSSTLYTTNSSAAQWIATNGATFYITGVQFEVGSIPTTFERRLYGTELNLCFRYYNNSSYPTFGNTLGFSGDTAVGVNYFISLQYPVRMRAAPTFVWSIFADNYFPASAPNQQTNGPSGINLYKAATTTGVGGYFLGGYTASAEL
jgi:hypothetical protein